MRVICTAGHVDHGKSSLVQALTGIDPDRLIEEKRRQMTIELGFAWLETPDCGQVGIVDVPGHRDFLGNMLTGLGGIDAVLLVVAADEGVMPQTREHIAIIDLLKINLGVVVLTKVDKVNDPEWLKLVEEELRHALFGTVLQDAEYLQVSSKTGAGIAGLKDAINRLLKNQEDSPDLRKPRLPIDRIFSLPGFGTIVTGTLVNGVMRVGDIVQVYPSNKTMRIRGLESYNKRAEIALPGFRTAVNLAGIEKNQVRRGDVIAIPGDFEPSFRIEARVEIIDSANSGLLHNQSARFFLAATERLVKIRLLEKKIIQPGEWAWVEVEFEDAIICDYGDRFILRRLSPSETLGGGVVINPVARRRDTPKDKNVVVWLENKSSDDSAKKLHAWIMENSYVRRVEIEERFSHATGLIPLDLESLIAAGKVIELGGGQGGDGLLISNHVWEQTRKKIVKFLDDRHSRYPLRESVALEDLGKGLNIPPGPIRKWVEELAVRKEVNFTNEEVSLQNHSVVYSIAQRKRIELYERTIEENPHNTPSVKAAKEQLGEEVYDSLLHRKLINQVSSEVFFRDKEYQQMLEYVKNTCQGGILLTVADFRDHFKTSRKYALAFLEHLDNHGITIREGAGRRMVSLKNGNS